MTAITYAEQLRTHVISHKEMKNAIEYVLNRKAKKGGRGRGNATDEMASQMLNLFGYGETITDNTLNPDERELFYFLDDEGMMRHEGGEEVLICVNGSWKRWRIKYWTLNKGKVIEFSNAYSAVKRSSPEDDPAAVYRNGEITDEMWKRAPEDADEAEVPKVY